MKVLVCHERRVCLQTKFSIFQNNRKLKIFGAQQVRAMLVGRGWGPGEGDESDITWETWRGRPAGRAYLRPRGISPTHTASGGLKHGRNININCIKNSLSQPEEWDLTWGLEAGAGPWLNTEVSGGFSLTQNWKENGQRMVWRSFYFGWENQAKAEMQEASVQRHLSLEIKPQMIISIH